MVISLPSSPCSTLKNPHYLSVVSIVISMYHGTLPFSDWVFLFNCFLFRTFIDLWIHSMNSYCLHNIWHDTLSWDHREVLTLENVSWCVLTSSKFLAVTWKYPYIRNPFRTLRPVKPLCFSPPSSFMRALRQTPSHVSFFHPNSTTCIPLSLSYVLYASLTVTDFPGALWDLKFPSFKSSAS